MTDNSKSFCVGIDKKHKTIVSSNWHQICWGFFREKIVPTAQLKDNFETVHSLRVIVSDSRVVDFITPNALYHLRTVKKRVTAPFELLNNFEDMRSLSLFTVYRLYMWETSSSISSKCSEKRSNIIECIIRSELFQLLILHLYEMLRKIIEMLDNIEVTSVESISFPSKIIEKYRYTNPFQTGFTS